MNDFEWGQEQHRNGNHPWSGNMNDAQADGYRWERWVRESEQRCRDQAEQRSRAPSAGGPADTGCSHAVSGGAYGSGVGGASGDDTVLPLLIGTGAVIVFVMVFWVLILAVAGVLLLGVIALYGYDIGHKNNGLRALDDVADDALADAKAWVATWPLAIARFSEGLAAKARSAAQQRQHREVVADSCTTRFRNARLRRGSVALLRLRLRLAKWLCLGAASVLGVTARVLYRLDR